MTLQLPNQIKPSPLPSGFFLDKSFLSSKHALWYGVKAPDDSEPFISLISTHNRIDDALSARTLVRQAYNSFSFQSLLKEGQCQPLLNRFVVEEFLDFYENNYEYKEDAEDEENVSLLLAHTKKTDESSILVASQTYTIEKRFCEPWWVEVVGITPPGVPDKLPWHNYYGNPEQFYFFTLYSRDNDKPLLLSSKENVLYFYTTYDKAGRMADLLNDHKITDVSQAPEQVIKKLYQNCDVSVKR